MSTSLAIVPDIAPAPAPGVHKLVAAWLAGRSARTIEAYRGDLDGFRRWLGAESVEHAAEALLSRGHGAANGLALAWRAHLLEGGAAPATCNRRLAALRSLVQLGQTLGLVDWSLQVPGVKSEPYRDTRGPGRAGVLRLLAALEERRGPKAARDRALLRLLYDLGLRRAEAVELDVEHVDLAGGAVSIMGKGRRERERLSLPAPTAAALFAWVAARGDSPGPLFTSLDNHSRGRRLSGRGVARVLGELGAAVGMTVRPHGLRHAAITAALDLTGGDVRAVQRFSRHRDLRTLLRYDDAREDHAGRVASLVALAAL